MPRVLPIALFAAPALGPLGCAGARLAVAGSMSRDRRALVLTGSEGGYVPVGEWRLRTTATQAGASLDVSGRARLWIAGGETALGISKDGRVDGHCRRSSWSTGFEVGHGPAAPRGVFVRLRASCLEAPEDPDVADLEGITETWDAALRRWTTAVLVGRAAPRGRAYCGVRGSSAKAYRLVHDTDTYHLAEKSRLGVVVGVEGEGDGAAVFLEAGLLDSTSVELGVRWTR